jgi:hypothetical protein
MTLDAAMGFYDSCHKGNVNVKYEQESGKANPGPNPVTQEGKPTGQPW